MKNWLLLLLLSIFGKNANAQEGFTLDETITGFKYDKTPDADGGIRSYAYSPSGDAGKNFSHFVVASMPYATFTTAKENADKHFKSGQQLKQVVNLINYETTVNGYKAYVYEYDANSFGKKSYNYDVFMTDGKKAICFSGVDIDNGKYINKFKATLQTVVLK